MITRSSLVFLICGLVVFTASAWGGYVVHRRVAVTQVLAQPGWCCSQGSRSCTVAQGMPECRARQGTVFNWDQASCNAVCAKNVAALLR